MDQGIIQNLKVHYRRHLLRDRIKAIETKSNILFNLLNALHFLRKSWGDVKPETIANCFRRAAFKIDDMPLVEEESESVDELLLAWARLQDLDGIDGAAEMFDYMHVDDEVVTDGAQTLEDIVEDVTANNNQLADSESMDIQEEDADPEEPPITILDALKAMEIVRHYTEKNFADPAILKHINICSCESSDYCNFKLWPNQHNDFDTDDNLVDEDVSSNSRRQAPIQTSAASTPSVVATMLMFLLISVIL
uniref:DDE-1 domain-containing protein n=1 Tax=Ditylenchus dipsaci TaxID=166011 RepID=A0A915EH28_9BILA